MIKIKIIGKEKQKDIQLPNEPFALFGRMLPTYVNEKWSYEIAYLPEKDMSTMCFPDENYDYEKLAQNSVFIGAYEEEKCIGLGILQHSWHKYMYLYDLKVNENYRQQKVGHQLIKKAQEVASEKGYLGLYTQGQDNNLGACLFYLHEGFYIGGLDTNGYKGTLQEGKKDIIFYLDNESS